jgi:hypothetical protein
MKKFVFLASICLSTVLSFAVGRSGPTVDGPTPAKACIPDEDEAASPDCPCGCCFMCDRWPGKCKGCDGDPAPEPMYNPDCWDKDQNFCKTDEAVFDRCCY